MSRPGGLLAWQWSTYADNHRERVNLVLHFFAVPAFIASTLVVLTGAINAQLKMIGVGLVGMIVSFAIQGIGHKREAVAPIPFASPLEFVARIFLEQFINFPRFVLSGGWLRALTGENA
jgi:uncharacterized membrane protein YGL010W